MRTFIVGLLSCLCLALPARAGIYSPDEPFLFEIDENGFARPIQFSGGFEPIIADFRDLGAPLSQATPKYAERIRDRRAKGPGSLSPVELAGYTADLIRLNRPDEVLNLLQPVARDPRRGGFLAFTHLARAHAGRGEWREAYEQQQMAIRYAEFPNVFARLTRPQLTWLKRIEREYYLPFLAHRAEEARGGRRHGLREDVDALFPTAIPPRRPDNPVKFVSEDGTYAAGKLAAAERAKLPPDAIAIVQQLLLWHPKDARLYWLLGELYNSEGEIDAAARLLDACTFNMGYSNPVVIEHRRVLRSAAETASAARAAEAARVRAELEADQARRDEAERDYQKRFWWIVAIGVALGVLLLYYQFRELIRRVRRPGRDS